MTYLPRCVGRKRVYPRCGAEKGLTHGARGGKRVYPRRAGRKRAYPQQVLKWDSGCIVHIRHIIIFYPIPGLETIRGKITVSFAAPFPITMH